MTPLAKPAGADVLALRPPRRWHDPLRLIQAGAPAESARVVLWTVSSLVLALLAWGAVGKLDVIVGAEGRLAPQTLLKVVQPAEPGVVRRLLVREGDAVKAGQVLALLDATLARAEQDGVSSELAAQGLQARRIEAELADRPMLAKAGDEPERFAQTQRQYQAHRRAFSDSVEQEQSMLAKVEQEKRSATEVLGKLEQTLPSYNKAAAAYARLEQEGFLGGLAAADKQREATEKTRDLGAQQATVAAFGAAFTAQQRKISQLHSHYRSELERELAEVRARIAQLQPNLDKTLYRQGLMELRAPQDGVIKDLATTTVGAVVQPGAVVLTLLPKGEQLFADVNIRNEDVGFVQPGQRAQIKLAAYPFQKYGMLAGTVIHVSADASDPGRAAPGQPPSDGSNAAAGLASYKARVRLDAQTLIDPQGRPLRIAAGMQVVAEIHQGKRTVMEYLLSPVQKAVAEAARER